MRKLPALLLLALAPAVLAAPAEAGNYKATLSGDNEVPAVQTDGRGHALFRLTDQGLEYRLIVNRLEGITQAHLHMAPAGENGQVVAFLFGKIDEGVTQNGPLAEGVITGADLVGPLAGQSLEALLEAIAAGNVYVNVHTLEHPPGEIRGQVEKLGRR